MPNTCSFCVACIRQKCSKGPVLFLLGGYTTTTISAPKSMGRKRELSLYRNQAVTYFLLCSNVRALMTDGRSHHKSKRGREIPFGRKRGGGREGEGNRLASAEEKRKGKGVRRMSLLFGRPTFCLSSAQLRDCTGKRKEIPPRYKTPLTRSLPFPHATRGEMKGLISPRGKGRREE